MHAFRNINEGSAAPASSVERAEFTIGDRNNRAKVFFENIREKLQTHVRGQENYAFLANFLKHVVINDLGFILGGYAGKEFLLRFRNAQLLERLLHGFGDFIPIVLLIFRNAGEIGVGIEIHEVQRGAIGRHGHPLKGAEGFQAELKHPLRLVFCL